MKRFKKMQKELKNLLLDDLSSLYDDAMQEDYLESYGQLDEDQKKEFRSMVMSLYNWVACFDWDGQERKFEPYECD